MAVPVSFFHLERAFGTGFRGGAGTLFACSPPCACAAGALASEAGMGGRTAPAAEPAVGGEVTGGSPADGVVWAMLCLRIATQVLGEVNENCQLNSGSH